MNRNEAIEVLKDFWAAYAVGTEIREAFEVLIPELKEKEAMWMQNPITGEFMPVSYPADAPLGQDMKGNLIYPDDIKVALEVKEVDLEKEPAREDFEAEWKGYCDSKGGGAVTMNIKDVARHFAEWGMHQKCGTSDDVFDAYKECYDNSYSTGEYCHETSFKWGFEEGVQWQKEQMMKGAIEGRLSSTVTGSEQYVSAYVGYGEYGKDGDKVKVIIIKG